MTIHKSIIITFYNNRGCTIQYRYCAMCYQMSQHYSRGTLEKFPYLPLCPAVVRCSISGECSRSFKLMKLENHPHESRLALRRYAIYMLIWLCSYAVAIAFRPGTVNVHILSPDQDVVQIFPLFSFDLTVMGSDARTEHHEVSCFTTN